MTHTEKSYYYNIDLSKSFGDIAYKLEEFPPPNQGLHYHEGYEIMQIWSDKGHVLIEDKIYPMKKGHIYIVNALESHCTSPDPSIPYVRSKITFSASYIKKLLEHMGQLHILDPFCNEGRRFSHFIIPDENIINEFERLFYQISTEYRMGSNIYPALINAYLIEMLALIYRYYSSDIEEAHTQNNYVNNHIRQIIEFININLYNDITIDMICEKLHLSKYYLCHLFKNTTSITVMQYIVERRISEAKKFLAYSDENISTIAMKAGFSSFSLFGRTFKRITGYTPLNYRKRFRERL